MFHEFYMQGQIDAMEKLGFSVLPAGQTAGSMVNKGFGVKFTKSTDNIKNLSPKLTNNQLGPTGRAGPSSTVPKVTGSKLF